MQTRGRGSQPTLPPPFTLLSAGPWIGDMWLGKMRHDAGLSLRQILCLSACLRITSLERLTKTEKEFCFPPLWLQQSPCSQFPSATGHCCLFSWHFLPLMARVGYRICSTFESSALFLLKFLDEILAISPGNQKCVSVCSYLHYMYATGLESTDKYVQIGTLHIFKAGRVRMGADLQHTDGILNFISKNFTYSCFEFFLKGQIHVYKRWLWGYE